LQRIGGQIRRASPGFLDVPKGQGQHQLDSLPGQFGRSVFKINTVLCSGSLWLLVANAVPTGKDIRAQIVAMRGEVVTGIPI